MWKEGVTYDWVMAFNEVRVVVKRTRAMPVYMKGQRSAAYVDGNGVCRVRAPRYVPTRQGQL